MTMSTFPHGFNAGVSIRGIPILNMYSGSVIWVDSVNGSNNYDGTRMWPKASIAYVVDNALVAAGDIIMCAPGHNESIVAAAGLDLDIAGICIVFLGQGSNAAKVTFSTAVGADIDIDAANITLVNPTFVSAIDALTGPIDVNAADFTILNGRWFDAAAMAVTNCVVADANADRMIIDGWRYFASTTGTQKVSQISVAATDDVVLKNIEIRGDFSTACINNSAAAPNLLLENVFLNNTAAGPVQALSLHANTYGFAKNVKLRVASGTTYVSSVAKMQWADDCEGFSTDGYTGEPVGSVLATGVEGKIDVIDGYFDVPTADVTTNTTVRDVAGNKTDAAVNAVGTTKTIMAYTKGIVNEITVPSADSTDNGFTNDVVGNKTDASVYVPGTNKSLAAYAKGTANLQERVATKAAAVMVNGDTLFTVAGGPIQIIGLVSICATLNDGTASTLQYSATPTTGSAQTISGASGSLANAPAGSSVSLIGTALATAALYNANGPNLCMTNMGGIMVPAGTITAVIGTGSTTGTWVHYLRYKPLAVGVTVS